METETFATAAMGDASALFEAEPGVTETLELPAILHALSDPIRLRIVTRLAEGDECACNSFGLPITKSTCSHHLRVLREAGLIEQRVDGKSRLNRLRGEALEQRFPGLLQAVLRAQSIP
jgi:DNA-binding transcriptional ArsR family regulator